MTSLQTIVPIPPSTLHLDHQRPILLIGSCFTEHISERLANSGFTVMANPFGILYNPHSIAECLLRCRDERTITDADLVCHDGIFHSWLHHSRFSHPDKDIVLQRCQQSLHSAHQFLQQNPIVILTLGTAYAYHLQGYGIVANCHKVPATRFTKQLLTPSHIISTLSQALDGLDSILTISPIRHWADTPHGNQLSKSALMLATNALPTHYFPAYEIMMDELRDYRFYEPDMLHPSSLAIDIIWERFCQTYFTNATLLLAKKYQQLSRMQAHRPAFPESEAYQQHLLKIEELKSTIEILRNAPQQSNTTSKHPHEYSPDK